MHAGKVRFYPVPNLVIFPFINWLMSFYPSVNQKIGDTFLIKAYTRRTAQCPSFWPIGTFLAGRTVIKGYKYLSCFLSRKIRQDCFQGQWRAAVNPESCCDFCVFELVKHVRTTNFFGKSWEMIRFALSPYPFGVNQALAPLSNLILIFPQ